MATSVEYVLSVRQPWAELILKGKKQGEFRTYPTSVRGRVYLYASKTVGEAERKVFKQMGVKETVPVGKIVGSVDILGCVPATEVWEDAPKTLWVWVLAYPKRLRTPVDHPSRPHAAFAKVPVGWKP